MALTSASTDAQVEAAYEDNADYDTTNSTTKAKDFIQASRFKMNRMAQEVRHGGASVRDEYLKYERALNAATGWLKTNDTSFAGGASGLVKHVSFEDFR